jgi:hypothetical protein
MRKVVVSSIVSLDGYVAGPGGNVMALPMDGFFDEHNLERQRNEEEHQEINEVAARLERTAHGDPERPQLVERLIDLLRQDARDEEDLILPRLQSVLDARTLRRLGRTWELVRRTAPTRPHPVVARRPPGNVVAALPLTVIDRARDRLDRVAGVRSLGSGATAVSRFLGNLAAAIEHVPPLTRGERPETHSGRTQDPARSGTQRDAERQARR